MSEFLVAFLGETLGDPVAWAAVRDGAVHAEGMVESFSALRPALLEIGGEIDVIAVLPGEQVAFRRLPAPPKGEAKFAAAAMLLLEDELAEPPADLHVALHRDDAGGAVAAVKRAVVERAVAGFAEAGVRLVHLGVDYLCLPTPTSTNGAAVWVGTNRILAFCPSTGFAAPTDLAGAAIYTIGGPSPVSVYAPEDWLPGEDWPAVEMAGEPRFAALALLAVQRAAAGGLNLLQGEFRPPRRSTISFGPYRRAGLLAASLVACLGAIFIAETVRTGALADRYDKAALELHTQAFPDAPATDIRRHARERLSSGASATFVDMTGRIDAALGEGGEVAVDRVQFDAARGAFTFSVRATSNEAIDAFRGRLSANGVAASDVSGYRRAGAAWVGDMAVRLP